MNVLIAGYPYVRESFLNTFSDPLNGGEVRFLLPDKWKIKGGKHTYTVPKRDGIFSTKAFFHHSHYPFIGGLLKGFMPVFPLFLWRLRYTGINLVFSPTEPILLSTLYQGIWTRVFGLKHVLFTWENIPYSKKFFGFNYMVKNIIFSLNMLLADGLVCGNQKSADIHKLLTKKPIAVIPLSGVDTEFFKRDNISDNSNDNNSGVVNFLFVGAISRHKGVFNLVDALAGLVRNMRNIHLRIVGSGDDDDRLDDYIKSKNLQNFITRHAWASHGELRKLLSDADIFVYPSSPTAGWEEQFGYSMAEASAMALPIIATHTGSIGETVIDGKTGLLIASDNSEELANAMEKLAIDVDFRRNLGRAGRIHIDTQFSYKGVAHKFRVFFSQLVA